MIDTINDHLNFLNHFYGIYLMIFIFLSTFISEDLTCITAGILASLEKMTIESAIFASTMGIFIGDLGLYGIGFILFQSKITFLGNKIGNKIHNFRNDLRDKHLKKIKNRLTQKGGWYIFITRFIPGTRLPTYLLANQIYPGLARFSSILLMGCLIWTPILVLGSFWIGAKITEYLSTYYNFWLYAFTLILIIYLSIKTIRFLSSYKNRKLLVGDFKRLYHWEFWPTWILYFPIVFYIIYLGIRFRSFTLFTISNPGIPFSGLMGESKSLILNRIQTKNFIADYFLIPSESERIHRLDYFLKLMKEKSYSFPIVLKPDIGERGKDVKIINNFDDAKFYLSNNLNEIICQKYIDGIEYGIQFARFPNEKNVTILSLCHKVYYAIYGNGKDNLEDLILNDPRAVCQARMHLKKFANELTSIPVAGKKVMLSSIGTHSRGSMFLDANSEMTKELQMSVQKVVLSIPDIYIGRFDVKVASKRDFFINGKFKILELNGLTGEPAHMYDPKHNVFYAWKSLFKTWRIAFELGKANERNGFIPASLKQLFYYTFDENFRKGCNKSQSFSN